MEKGGWVRGKLCIRARSTKKPFEVSCFRDELHAWLDILAPLTSPFSLTLPLFASLSIPPSLFYGEGGGGGLGYDLIYLCFFRKRSIELLIMI